MLSGCSILIGLRHMSFGLRIISVPGGNISCSCVDDDSEMNTFPTFCLPTLFPKVEREDVCRTSMERETVETKRSFYLHFHMCLTFGDVKLLSQKALNRRNMCAICLKRPSRLRVMYLSPHFKCFPYKLVGIQHAR